MNDSYWERMEYLRDRIQDQQILKEAQVPYGADYDFFQNEITNLTTELLDWEENIDELDRLDADIAAVNTSARIAQRNASRSAGTWVRVATLCGLIAVLLLAISVRWSLSPLLPGAGALLLALAGVAVFMSMTARTSARDAMALANDQIADISAVRDALIPPSYPRINPFPRFSHEVVVRDAGNRSRSVESSMD